MSDVHLSELKIREAVIDDLDGIMAVENASFNAPWPISAIVDELVGRSWSKFYIAEFPEGIVGFMNYWIVDTERHLLNFAILPSYRRKGIGRRMLSYLVNGAIEEKATQILLEVRVSNVAAQSLYMANGFKQIAIRPKYYADNGEDALVMALELVAETG